MVSEQVMQPCQLDWLYSPLTSSAVLQNVLQLDEMLLRCMYTRLRRRMRFLVSFFKYTHVCNSCIIVLSACRPAVSLSCLAALSNECLHFERAQ